MGFDAIWITPVVENLDGGYHGYWAKNIYNLNPNFGTENDLLTLKQELRNRGMYLMIDVVANHMGQADFSELYPFNSTDHYHDCVSDCQTSNCNIEDWSYTDWAEIQNCKLANLPDLKQENPFVAQTLENWVKNYVVDRWGADGLRIDTIPEVKKEFWKTFSKSAGVYTVGEIFNGDAKVVGPFQGFIDGTLGYVQYYGVLDVFQSQRDMGELDAKIAAIAEDFSDPAALANFVDNHDNARFLSKNGDYALYKNALLYTLFSTGIPIVYYGSEQGFNGGNDPYNREALWTTGYNTGSELYKFIQTAIAARKQWKVWNSPQVRRYVDSNFYAFSRGEVLILTTNVGQHGKTLQRNLYYPGFAPDGFRWCNVFYPQTDCITWVNDGATVYLSSGECKIYVPANSDVSKRAAVAPNYNQTAKHLGKSNFMSSLAHDYHKA